MKNDPVLLTINWNYLDYTILILRAIQGYEPVPHSEDEDNVSYCSEITNYSDISDISVGDD